MKYSNTLEGFKLGIAAELCHDTPSGDSAARFDIILMPLIAIL